MTAPTVETFFNGFKDLGLAGGESYEEFVEEGDNQNKNRLEKEEGRM